MPTSSIVPQENQFDLLSKYLARNPDIRRGSVNSVVYYVMEDVLEVIADEERTTDIRKFWNNVKRSIKRKEMSLNLRQLDFPSKRDGKSYVYDVADWEAVLVIVGGLSDKRAQLIYRYAMHFVAEQSQPALVYRMRELSYGRAWAADEIHDDMKQLMPPDSETADEDRGYRR